VGFLVHEAFHQHQIENFSRSESADVWAFEDLDGAHLGMLREEEAHLFYALTANDVRGMRRSAAEYLRLNRERLHDQPRLRVAEWQMERIEGTAQWLGEAASGMVRGEGPPVEHTIAQQLRDVARLQVADRAWLHRARLYASGAALTVLLEKLGGDWREEVSAGASLQEALEKRL
jgi:hypothetical protein